MTTAAERVYLTGMDLWDEYDRLMEEVDKHDPALRAQLSEVVVARLTEAENNAVRNQGQVILAAIRGDLVAWPGSMPDWYNRPEAP